MKWLRKILGLCEHQYDIVKTRNFKSTSLFGSIVGELYVSRCNKCGKLKNHRAY